MAPLRSNSVSHLPPRASSNHRVTRYLVGAGKAVGVDIWGDSRSRHVGAANGFDLRDDPKFGIVQELRPELRKKNCQHSPGNS